MAQYLKLAHAAEMVAAGQITKAQLLDGIVDAGGLSNGDYIVVNLKGRILKRSEVERHLNGTLDGETVSA